MQQKINAYELAGLKIRMQDMPEVLETAIDKAFSLSRIEPVGVDIALRGKGKRLRSMSMDLPGLSARRELGILWRGPE